MAMFNLGISYLILGDCKKGLNYTKAHKLSNPQVNVNFHGKPLLENLNAEENS